MTPAAAIAYHDIMIDVAEVAMNSNEPLMDRATEERLQIDRADECEQTFEFPTSQSPLMWIELEFDCLLS